MHASLPKIFGAAILATTLVACSSDSTVTMDMTAAIAGDMAGDDGSAGNGCLKTTTIGTWMTTASPYAGIGDPEDDNFDYFLEIAADEAETGSSSVFDVLHYQYYHQAGMTEVIPRTVTIPANGQYNTCIDCVFAKIGETATTDGTFYFATKGTLMVAQADHTGSTGTISVSGTNIHLEEWVYNGNGTDAPVAGGSCVDVGSFNFTATWIRSDVDGGTDL